MADPKKNGRPTEYDAKYAAMAREIVAESGLSQAKLAKVFKVGRTTITDWKKAYPEFADALQAGEDIYKVKIVEKNLFRLCKGIRVKTKREILKIGGKVSELKMEHYYPPNPKAIEFFLRSRDPERWPNKTQHELSGPGGAPVQYQIITGVERGPGDD